VTNKVLAIDYGRERVGLAVASQGVPRGLQTLTNDADIMDRLAAAVDAQEARVVVLGLPRTSDGNDTAWTGEVRRFAEALARAVKVPVTLQDEFATTAEAKARLTSRKLSAGEQKALVDQEAAVILLEEYLSAL